MADKWEMCDMDAGDFSMVFFSPLGFKVYSAEDFIKKYDPSFSKPDFPNDKEEEGMINRFWSLFMSEEWEPYSVAVSDKYSNRYSFRRKYQG